MLEVTRAEAQVVRTFVVGAACPKMSETMALETGFPVMGVVRLQWGESELAIQGSLCADLIISSVLHSAHFASWERGDEDG